MAGTSMGGSDGRMLKYSHDALKLLWHCVKYKLKIPLYTKTWTCILKRVLTLYTLYDLEVNI